MSAYARSRIAEFESEIREHAAELAVGLGETCDLVQDFLAPFVLRSMAVTMGLPQGEMGLLEKVIRAIASVLARPVFDAEAARAIDTCMTVLRRFLDHMLRLDDPPPSVLALEAVAADEARGGVWNAVSALAHVLSAGLHPTTAGAALVWLQWQREPRIHEAVADGAMDMGDVVDEVLRLCPPFPAVHRWAQSELELEGQRLEEGDYVLVDLEAANRDPGVFDDPEVVKKRSNASGSLAFGHGAHRCMGSALARVQIEAALDRLLGLDRPLVLDGEPSITGRGDFGRLIEVRAVPCRRIAVAGRAAALHSAGMEGRGDV